LRREINSQNQVGSAENLALTHGIHLHDEKKFGVWCAMSIRRENSTVSRQELQRVTNPVEIPTRCSFVIEFIIYLQPLVYIYKPEAANAV
jgi:hypothetical protein